VKRPNDLVRLVGIILVLVAVYKELSKPPEERRWHGSIADFVPYDLRVPTVDLIMAKVWNEEDDRLFMPTIFGVGWTVNWASVVSRLRQATSSA
jgi:hypothetical protein